MPQKSFQPGRDMSVLTLQEYSNDAGLSSPGKRNPRGPLKYGRSASKAMTNYETVSRRTHLLWCLVFLLGLAGCATAPKMSDQAPPFIAQDQASSRQEGVEERESAKKEEATLEEKWGIKVLGIRQSAGGYMLDFRYRIVDPEKALPLMDRKFKPYLIHQQTGAKFMVPSPPKVGPLRQTVRSGKPEANRNYFVLFANPGKYVNPGSKVTVVIGDFRAENLVVE